jgi:arthrofactin-type cyclic lipopeptide synthetase C
VATAGVIQDDDDVLHIGQPISNARVYILDEALEPVPIGVTGEIFVGGRGVARGYLNRSELNASRFVTDPFVSATAARMYRTGDLGRWRADGSIEYVGRNDDQVKIRGMRVELKEVETHLMQNERVEHAAASVRKDQSGSDVLAAYLVTKNNERPDIDGLRARLGEHLPPHMIPSAFVVMPRLPLNANGKVDRRALPEPERTDFVKRKFEPPTGDVECMLAAIWQETLRIDRVGRHDSFFELGGHSLVAVALTTSVAAKFGVTMPPTAVFEHPTIESMSTAIEALIEKRRVEDSQLARIPREAAGARLDLTS